MGKLLTIKELTDKFNISIHITRRIVEKLDNKIKKGIILFIDEDEFNNILILRKQEEGKYVINDNKKRCRKCEEIKEIVFYRKDIEKVDGYDNYCKVCCKEYEMENKDKRYKRKKKWYKNNPEKTKKMNAKSSKKQRERIKNSPTLKLAMRLRVRLIEAIKGNYKVGSAVNDLGCSIVELKERLEKMFYDRSTGEKMNWGNWSLAGWHIDHIIPLSSFDLTDREQFLKAVNYTNLQPLWAEHNLAKNDKLDWVKK